MLVLIYDKNDENSNDWEGNILHYIGEEVGENQGLTGNKEIILKSKELDLQIYLFMRIKENEYLHLGNYNICMTPYLKKIKSKNFYVFPLREDYEKLINSYLFDLYKCGEKYCAYDFLANYHALTFNEIFNCLNKKMTKKRMKRFQIILLITRANSILKT